jgi:hypothetical protein
MDPIRERAALWPWVVRMVDDVMEWGEAEMSEE